MKYKKKGFTLIELLAVTIIISLVAIILVPKMIERFETKKEEFSNQAKDLIYLATSQYLDLVNSEASCILIRDLIDNGLLIEPVIDIKTNTVVDTSTSVKVTRVNNQYNYELTDNCSYNVTFKLKNVSVDKKDFTIDSTLEKEVTVTPFTNYLLPEAISVKGSNYSWNKTGKLVLKNAYTDVIVKIEGVSTDNENPTIIVSPSSGSYEGSVNVTISVNDNIGLDPNNVYQYYISTSSTKRENGAWTSYTSNIPFEITGTEETKYLWIWPVKDTVGNISGNKSNVNTPYVAGIYKFYISDKTPPVLTVNEVETDKVYEDGEVVYFDVLKGTTCDDYDASNYMAYSTIFGTTSCLKFYAFNYEKGDNKVNLILNHENISSINYMILGSSKTKSSLYAVGPKDFISSLKSYTSSWLGTLTPLNYTVKQTNWNYTIDYSDAKARLITANEIAKITGNTSFNESTSSSEDTFYFDTNTSTPSSTCNEDDTSGCKFSWLYSHGYRAYYTVTTVSGTDSAWVVSEYGALITDGTFNTRGYMRPVIEIPKSNKVVINAYDNESGLSSDNNYQYYLSTSSTTLENGEWKSYTIGDVITINSGKTLYLWLYPIKDKVGNVNDNKVYDTPYVALKLEKTYTITYDLDGGTLSSSNPSTYTSETESFTLNNPSKEGYKFIGWTGSNGDTPSTSVTLEKGSISDKSYKANYLEWTTKFKNGDIVYYDVLTGKRCTNYHTDNSINKYNGVTTTTTNQTSCLKFYAFNYNEGDEKVNLILDHNTSAQIAWNSSGSNSDGPITALTQLKTDTSSWVGTITPESYTVSQTTGGNYTVDYSGYKARLITAGEVAKITNNTSFNESTSDSNNWFYFDTNSQTSSSTYSYGWLYDRTSTTCTDYGCLNNTDSGYRGIGSSPPIVYVMGYWTSTATFGDSISAWYIDSTGSLKNVSLSELTQTYYTDIRPVIEVLKSNL